MASQSPKMAENAKKGQKTGSLGKTGYDAAKPTPDSVLLGGVSVGKFSSRRRQTSGSRKRLRSINVGINTKTNINYQGPIKAISASRRRRFHRGTLTIQTYVQAGSFFTYPAEAGV